MLGSMAGRAKVRLEGGTAAGGGAEVQGQLDVGGPAGRGRAGCGWGLAATPQPPPIRLVLKRLFQP